MAKAMSAQPRPAAARPMPKRPENTLSPLRIVYYRRMRLQHVYTFKISWSGKEGVRPPAGARPVTLRLLMAGAQVVPSEQMLDPAKPDASASFHVTPLAKGHLRGERLEVLIDDRKVQEVRLRSSVTSQRLTFVLLALTFLVPWFLLHYCKYSVLRERNSKEFAMLVRTPGALLDARVKENVPEVPEFIVSNAPMVANWLDETRDHLTNIYQLLVQSNDRYPLAFYSALALLFLTLVSWRLRGAKRKKLTSQPIPLPALAGASAAAHDEDDDE
ncbi:MAG: hypothetical protein FJ271_01285 [Planctomycetes bacterium]|nr:hypothetical protein [Planctomycetota bacterium]